MVDEIIVPIMLPNCSKPVRVYHLDILEEYKDHKRHKVFYNKGYVCVNCGVEGKYMIKSRCLDDHIHTDIYTEHFIMMTVDHIHPISHGGSSSIDNLQPMCSLCNTSKSDKIISIMVSREPNLIISI